MFTGVLSSHFRMFCLTFILQADWLCRLCRVYVHPGNVHAKASDQTLRPVLRWPFLVFSTSATPGLTFHVQSGLAYNRNGRRSDNILCFLFTSMRWQTWTCVFQGFLGNSNPLPLYLHLPRLSSPVCATFGGNPHQRRTYSVGESR